MRFEEGSEKTYFVCDCQKSMGRKVLTTAFPNLEKGRKASGKFTNCFGKELTKEGREETGERSLVWDRESTG